MKKKPNEESEMRAEYDFSGGVRGKYAGYFTDPNLSAYTLPTDWVAKSAMVSSISRDLCADAFMVSSNISSVLSTQFSSLPMDQYSTLTSRISADNLGINRLVANADALGNYSTIAPSLLGHASLNSYLQIPSAVALTSSYLDSATALASAVRVDTQHLAGINIGSYVAATIQDADLTISNQVLRGAAEVNNFFGIANRLENGISSVSYLLDTTLATSRITSEALSAATTRGIRDYLSATTSDLAQLTSLGTAVYTEIAATRAIEPSSFLFAAPTLEPYAQVQATSVMLGVQERQLEEQSEPTADDTLDALGDDLEQRLSKVDSRLAEAYREGLAAINAGNKGWIRHAGVSFRTMFDHLLRELAPSETLDRFLDNPESYKREGEYLRSARLRYIFREVAVGSYARMAEHDMKLAEATFFPTNEIVHQLGTPLTDRQMKVLFRRIQGSVSVVLAATGY